MGPKYEPPPKVPHWKRELRLLVSRLTVAQTLLIAAIMLVAAAGLDFLIDANTLSGPFTALYMVPVGFVAWVIGIRYGLATAVVVTAVEGLISDYGLAHRARPFTVATTVGLILMELLAMVAIAILMARLRAALEQERNLSRKDPLTGLENLRAFWEELEIEVERMGRDKRPLAVVYIDVDDFKMVNDSFGHENGDDVLRMVGRTLKDSVRAIDTTARVGGDEFALILPNADESVAKIVVERLRSKFATFLNQKGLKATLSIGVAVFHKPPARIEEAVAVADQVMYEAKGLGKDCIAFRTC